MNVKQKWSSTCPICYNFFDYQRPWKRETKFTREDINLFNAVLKTLVGKTQNVVFKREQKHPRLVYRGIHDILDWFFINSDGLAWCIKNYWMQLKLFIELKFKDKTND